MLPLTRLTISKVSKLTTSARPKKLMTRELLILNLPERLNSPSELMAKTLPPSSLRTLPAWCHPMANLLPTGLRLLLITTPSFSISPRLAKLIFKSTIMALVLALQELTGSPQATETVT
jgi:hypothetical protein